MSGSEAKIQNPKVKAQSGEAEAKAQSHKRALMWAALRAAIARASDEQLGEGAGEPRRLAEGLAHTKLDESQIRNLENVAYTTDKVSDITDLLKKQVGRDREQERWAKDNLGKQLIDALQAIRKDTAEGIAEEMKLHYEDVVDDDLPRRVHLELCREFVKHLAAHFLYTRRGEREG